MGKGDFQMREYWKCKACHEKDGGVADDLGACTMILKECPDCGIKQCLIPWVDFNWPKDGKKDLEAKVGRD